jgi:hypothetical protein
VRELLDDYVEYKLGELLLAIGTCHQGTAVKDDPGGPFRQVGQIRQVGQAWKSAGERLARRRKIPGLERTRLIGTRLQGARLKPGQRDRLRIVSVRYDRRDLLHAELDPG